jgi:hypothetical protein
MLSFGASSEDSNQSGVWIIGTDGQGLKPLLLRAVKSSHPGHYIADNFGPVSWSPDSRWILCMRAVHVVTDGPGKVLSTELWKLSADGKKLVRLSKADYDYAVWSPDGKSIVCWKGRPAQPELVSGGTIWVMDSNGRRTRQVLSSAAFEKLSSEGHSRRYDVSRPFWYTNSRHLIVPTYSYQVKQVRYGKQFRPAVTEKQFDLWVVDIAKGIPEHLGEGGLQSGSFQGKHFLIRVGEQDKHEIIEVDSSTEQR